MKLSGWGKYPEIEAKGYVFETPFELQRCLENAGDVIAYGKGRSYGDSALNENVIFSRRFDKILSFDADKGVITCESGVSLSDIIEAGIPKGWFLSVTPGTKFITTGGAIASDVHGKNHHNAGCFSESVLSFDLMLPDGSVAHCSREENTNLFQATCGGMGLTGVILTVTLQLQPVQSTVINETVFCCENLDKIFSAFETYRSVPYSVAWIDCLAKGNDLGRSVFMMGEHAASGGLTPPKTLPSFSIPYNLPGFCLNKYSIDIFNQLYYGKNPPHKKNRTVSIDSFFYPLDAIGGWNRLYGKNGFTQYQCVLPEETSFKGLQKILQRISSTGFASFLAVLKLFGPQNANFLSFPMKGYTLALDFKIRKNLFTLLNELDKIVLDQGGRLYLAKDVRMKRDILVNGYPGLKYFEELRETYGMKEKFSSLQSRRLEI